MTFYKFHGTGNDFILLDDRQNQFNPAKGLIIRMCNRHIGIGADGLILLRQEEGYDFRMVYFNSDGNESTMCGNGGRCIIAFADFLSLIRDQARFIAIDGEHSGVILGRETDRWQVRLRLSDVGHPRILNGEYLMDTGSPHLVRFVENADRIDVVSMGRQIRHNPEFGPGGVNVDFVETTGAGLYVRTYERGVEDETLSCGTGVTASALAYALRSGNTGGTMPVSTKGGELTVSYQVAGSGFNDIWLEGPAAFVFKGHISL